MSSIFITFLEYFKILKFTNMSPVTWHGKAHCWPPTLHTLRVKGELLVNIRFQPRQEAPCMYCLAPLYVLTETIPYLFCTLTVGSQLC